MLVSNQINSISISIRRWIQYQFRTQSPQSSWSRNEGLWHNPFVFPTNPGDPVLLHMCKVFQNGGHANRNTLVKKI